MLNSDIDDIELELFIHAMQLRYGYDFSQYTRASFSRRVRHVVDTQGLETIGALTAKLLRDAAFMPVVVAGLSVPVSEMFRNPAVFKALREDVLPMLASYPRINIWQAGCANGEEVYSLAICLQEQGLYERSQIYATDFNEVALSRAAEGIFPLREARGYSQNYLAAGGEHSLSDYYHARYERIKLDDSLKRNITFANHNLVTDGVFCEAHLILCRNVLIYFADSLQNRALTLFRDSLVRGGFLCLGSRENIEFAAVRGDFDAFNPAASLYRRAAKPV